MPSKLTVQLKIPPPPHSRDSISPSSKSVHFLPFHLSNHSTKHLIMLFSYALIVRRRQATDLAGVDNILNSLTAFMLRSFALLGTPAGAQYRDVASVGLPAVLLCGAPGSGRTSIAKEAMRRLAVDERVFARKCPLDAYFCLIPSHQTYY